MKFIIDIATGKVTVAAKRNYRGRVRRARVFIFISLRDVWKLKCVNVRRIHVENYTFYKLRRRNYRIIRSYEILDIIMR